MHSFYYYTSLFLAGHGRELPFVFHTFEEVYNPEDLKFADIVSAYWGNFVKSGDPNTPSGIEVHNSWMPTSLKAFQF